MSCTTCSSGSPKGCKNNGTCGTDGCNKLTVFDWLSNMNLPQGQKPCPHVEVRFKSDRKAFFINTNDLPLSIGDAIAVEANSGYDIGVVTLTGELVRVQMRNKKVKPDSEEVLKVYRKATDKDVDVWLKARDREDGILREARKIADILRLEMKLCDVEFQGDASKAIFYYTADNRVDFRQLIRDFASAFKIRVEMRQIGYRQQAAKVGGIGSCGRELCCSTWLTDFRTVSTSSARYQQLSINPQKLAGQCGKLKCCLNFELDTYLDAINDFPSIDTSFKTDEGLAKCVKIDVFRRMMWFVYDSEFLTWYQLPVDEVKKILILKKEGKKIPPLKSVSIEPESKDFLVDIKAPEEGSLKRFDTVKPKKRQGNKKRFPKNNQRKSPKK